MSLDLSTETREPQPTLAETRALLIRELHDLVSHAVSQIVIQAGVLQTVAAPDALQPGSPLVVLQHAARAAMEDLRRMGVVVNEGLAVPYGPQPGVERLGELLDAHRRAGLDIDAQLAVGPVEVRSSASLTLYRAVEETLQLLPHTPGAAVASVRFELADGGLLAAIDVRSPEPLTGLGDRNALATTRERVRLQGGTMHVMHDDPTTWILRAWLPTT